MAREFHFSFDGSAENLIAGVRKDCEKNGLTLEGDSLSGRVKGLGLKAFYTIEDHCLCVIVEKIPIFLSWSFLDRRATLWLAVTARNGSADGKDDQPARAVPGNGHRSWSFCVRELRCA